MIGPWQQLQTAEGAQVGEVLVAIAADLSGRKRPMTYEVAAASEPGREEVRLRWTLSPGKAGAHRLPRAQRRPTRSYWCWRTITGHRFNRTTLYGISA